MIIRRLTLLVTLLFILNFLQGQEKKVEIFTEIDSAEFIPYIGNQPLVMVPVKSFIIDADTLNNFTLTIHFQDETIFDIVRNLHFDFLKYKKYEIVEKNKIVRKVEHYSDYQQDTLFDKYTIRNLSLQHYLSNLSSIE